MSGRDYSMVYNRHAETQWAILHKTAADAIKPPDDIEIDEWAENSFELSHRVSPWPGLVRLEAYQRKPVQSFKHNERVVLIWPSQTGKTIIIQITMGWVIDQAPGPGQYVGPNQAFCKNRSKKHLQPAIQDSTVLAQHLTGDRHDFQLFDYVLDTCNISLRWAGSATMMAGEPVMYLWRDEFDKYEDATDKESNAFRLSTRRTEAYGAMRHILDATTPTVEEADGWDSLLGGTYEEWYVPCPNCAEGEQSHDAETGEKNKGWFVFHHEHLRYPRRETEGRDPEPLRRWLRRVKREAYYECPECGHAIRERFRYSMVQRGNYWPREPDAEYPSFHLHRLVGRSSACSFGSVAARWVEAQESDEAMQDFMNADAARPYKPTGNNATEDLILEHRGDYASGQIPTDEPVILIMSADIHNTCHHWAVWACAQYKTWLVDFGKLESSSIDRLVQMRQEMEYQNTDSKMYPVEALFVDVEWRPEDVYNLALADDYVIPITGRQGKGLVSWTQMKTYPESDKELDHPIRVLSINDEHFKEQLLRRIEKGRDENGQFMLENADWILPSDISREFVKQLLGEVVVKSRDTRGYEVRTWKKVGANHWLDVAKYALGARYVLKKNLRELNEPTAGHESASAAPDVYGEKPDGW